MELLTVVLVIGVLASLAIPAYLRQQKKSIDASIKSDILNVAKAAEAITADLPSHDPATTALAFPPAQLRANGATESFSNYVLISGTPARGYCVVGATTNNSGTYALGAAYFWFDSTRGGMQPKAQPISAFPAAGPCGATETAAHGWSRVSW